MSILKKFLSTNLSKYEDQQKKRYKKYVKIAKQDATIIPKSEAEVYEDNLLERGKSLINKSLRQSKRRAPEPKKQQEIVFKEPNNGLSLGPGPALLEVNNRYVSIEDIPKKFEEDVIHDVEEITYRTPRSSVDIRPLPNVPKRRRSRRSVEGMVCEDVRLSLPDQRVIEKYQAVEVSRVSISTTNSDLFYDCIDESDGFDSFIQTNETENNEEIPQESYSPPNEYSNNLVIFKEENTCGDSQSVQFEPPIWMKDEYNPPLIEIQRNPDVEETQIPSITLLKNDDIFVSSDSGDSDDTLVQSFNDYLTMEPTPFQITKEFVKLDDQPSHSDMMVFSDEEGNILEDFVKSNRKDSMSSEDDVFEIKSNRKVNFDFANSFCKTYNRQPSSSDDTSLTSTTTDDDNTKLYNFSIIGDQVVVDPDSDINEKSFSFEKDHVFKSFGVLDHSEKNDLEPIYENPKNEMDMALLNCKNGYREVDTTEDEENDQFSEAECIDFDVVLRKKNFQDYFDNIGEYKGKSVDVGIQRQSSIPEIQDDLKEIETLNDVVKQIDRIQEVLNKIREQIELLESKADENYTPLLKTLLNSMKILGNLNCNFDEELLKFQQETMDNISRCIEALKDV